MPTNQQRLLKALPLLISGVLFATIMRASAADHVVGGGLYDIIVGDFDGDQMSDVIRQGVNRQEQHSAILAAVQQAGIQRWRDGFLNANWNRDAAQLVVGDFNGDASSDVIVQSTNPLALATVVHAYADGHLGLPVQTIGAWYLGLQWDAAHHRLFTADFNGDGRDDLFLQGHKNSDRHAVALASDNGTFEQIAFDFDSQHLNRDWAASKTTIVTGDFDGNGRFELLLQPAASEESTLVVGSPSTRLLDSVQTTIPAQHLNLDWGSNRHRAVAGDFNGDGKDDIFLLAAHAVEQSAYLPSSSAGFERIDKVIERIPDLEQLKQVLVGDFDADGIDDLILLFNDPKTAPIVLLANPERVARLQALLEKLGLVKKGQQLRSEEGKRFESATSSTTAAGAESMNLVVRPNGTGAPPVNGKSSASSSQNSSAKTATAGAEPAPQEYGGSGGSFRVSESGAATYSFAVAAAPGSGGVSPQISLNYSSQAGNGMMGMGWSIGGLSAISRCSATKETDGVNLPLSFGPDAKYCLGGQRLLPASGVASSIGSCPAGGSVLAHLVPEVYSGAVITACSRGTATLANPSYFALFQKDGSVSFFGDFNGSYGDATMELNERSAGSVVATALTVFWAISRFSDSVGNAIDYRYNKNVLTGEHLIRSILYTGIFSASQTMDESAAPARVNFMYEPRHDTRTYYNRGSVTQSTKRLDYVETRGEAGQYRRYDLYYAPSSAAPVSQLEYLQECRNSTCLPAVKFSWSRPTPGFTPSPQAAVDFSSRYRGGQAMDLNGDGLLDYAWLSEKTQHDRFYWESYITRNTGGVYSLNHPADGQTEIRADDAIEHNGAWYPFDFNGDGRQDVIYPSGNWKVILARADGALEQIIDTKVPVKSGRGASFADVTGDGLPDIVQVVSSTNTLHVSRMKRGSTLGTGYEFWPIQQVAIPTITRSIYGRDQVAVCVDPYHLSTMDAQGDGRQDLVITAYFATQCPVTNPTYELCLFTCQNVPVQYWTERIVLQSIQAKPGVEATILFSDDSVNRLSHELVATEVGQQMGGGVEKGYTYFADMNGDGLTDVVSRPLVGKPISVLLGTGNGFTQIASLTDINNSHLLEIIDHNGDGLLDILFPGEGGFKARHFQSDGTFGAAVLTNAGYFDLDDCENRMFDLTGDGRPDLLKLDAAGDTTRLQIHLYSGDHTASNVISGIETLGTNAKTFVTYAALNKPGTTAYARGVNANTWVYGNGSPIYDVTGPMYVVSSAASDTVQVSGAAGSGMSANTTRVDYRYSGLRMQAGGRGSLGFESITTYDAQSRVTTTTQYEQLFPFTGMPKLTRKVTATGVEIARSESRYKSERSALGATAGNALGYGGIITYADYQEDTSRDLNGALLSRTTTTTTLNDYGNAVAVSVAKHDNTGTSHLSGRSRSFTTSDFGTDTLGQFYGRLASVSVAADRDGVALPTRTSAFEYHDAGAQKRLLKAEIVEPNGNEREYLRTEYQYDAFGNKTQTTIRSCHLARPGSNCAGASDASNATFINRTASVEYDPRGRFPVRSRNHFGHITEEVLARNDIYLPTQVKGATGIVSSTEYTVMGRPWRSSDSTGNWSESYLQRCDGTVTCLNSAKYRIESRTASGGSAIEHYDLLGRVVAKQVASFVHRANGYVTTLIEYDSRGRPVHASRPFFSNSGSAVRWEKSSFDDFDRVTQVTHPNNTSSYSSYAGLTVTHTNELGQTRVEVRNALGELESVRDNAGKTIYYKHDHAGRLDTLSRVDNIGLQSDLDYDRLGRKIYMWDADKSPGTRGVTGWRYEYNALGELTKQTDPRGYTAESWYDALGRVTTKLDKSNTGAVLINHSWSYATADTAEAKAGQLTQDRDAVSGYQRQYKYDGYGRLVKTIIGIDSTNYEERTSYNSIGQVEASYDITNKGLRYKRNDSGFVYEVQDADNASIVFQRIEEIDASGNVTRETLGNGARISRSFYADTGLLQRIKTEKNGNVIQNLYYEQWDAIGNLMARTDTSVGKNLREVFSYDSMNRLTSTDAGDPTRNLTLTYDNSGEGNLLTKSDVVGSYTYGTKETACTSSSHAVAGPHALTQAAGKSYCYDRNGNQVSGNGRTLSYANTFDLPTEIIGSNGHTTRYSYASGGGRYKRTDTVGADVTTTYFLGSVELIKKGGTTEHRRSIPNGIITNGNPSYILKDHLGSTDVILDCNGNVSQSFSFDAFGNQRHQTSWKIQTGDYTTALLPGMRYLSPRSDAKTFHGFTGHEMVDELGLIHMNGRMYDPNLGRFLQADPYIQSPKSSQSLNRYSYVLNNPLNATDPSGFFLDGITMGVAAGIATRNAQRSAMSNWSYEHGQTFVSVASFGCMAWYAACYAAGTYDNARAHGVNSQDAFSAAARAGITSYISSMMFNAIGNSFESLRAVDAAGNPVGGVFDSGFTLGEYLSKVGAHGVAGGVMSYMQGGKFGHGFASAGVAQATAPWIDTIGGGDLGSKAARISVAALVGGTVSELTGGKFANGAITAAFARAFNDEAEKKNRIRSEQATEERDAFLDANNIGPKELAKASDFLSKMMRDDAYAAALNKMYPDVNFLNYGQMAYIRGEIVSVMTSDALSGTFTEIITDLVVNAAVGAVVRPATITEKMIVDGGTGVVGDILESPPKIGPEAVAHFYIGHAIKYGATK